MKGAEEKLLKYVATSHPAECWEWKGARNPVGYGRMRLNGKMIYPHRLTWDLKHGPIKTGLLVCHTCDNPPCCNPAHLFLGTHADNSADCVRKGRHKRVSPRGQDAGRAKLTNAQVVAIRNDPRVQRLIAADYHIDSSSVSDIKNRITWRHMP